MAEALAARIPGLCAGIFAQAVMHVPVGIVTQARARARELDADCLVAIGGGSTTGLAKGIALDSELPAIVIPTTYAGSEMTPIYGLTENGAKRTGRDLRVLPRTVLYDPALTYGMSAELTATSGMNAIAHAVEALYAENANPIMSLMAEEGITALARGLPVAIGHPTDPNARSDCLYGAWLCGVVLGNVGMALHHKLCHILGGSFNLPHAPTHTVVLPHAVAYNTEAAPQAMARIARALGHPECSAAEGLYALAAALGAPLSLRSIGMREDQLDRAASLAVEAPYANPRRIEKDAIRRLLQDAFEGKRPTG
jgi:maleylacetate reductase